LLGVVTFRDLIVAPGDKLVKEVMRTEVISAPEDLDQEALSQLFMRHHLMMVPVVDAEGRIKGIVSVDDIVHVVQEEATEDIQKIGGVETLEGPYLQIPLLKMIQKRAGWLAALFLGEMLTATAMGQFEAEIARAVVLALFVPLIISSGGNSGSQATTLVIRAMALGEVRLRDWWRVIRREFVTGLGLGTILAAIGLTRILLWQGLFNVYGDHYFLLAMTVALSLIGVVMWGSLIGSILPFILRGLGFDPASASAPFVATLVDVTGLVIYFSVAAMVLRGTLL
jgi:magnesium transporter